MRRITRRLLWALAFVFAFVLIWRKVRIVVLVHANLWQLSLLFLGLAVGIYLVFELLLKRSNRY
jgi:hypothetical protein